VAADGLHQLGYLHLASVFLEVLGDAFLGSLAKNDEEIEFSKRDVTIFVDISNMHDIFNLSFVLFEIPFVVLWFLEIVRS